MAKDKNGKELPKGITYLPKKGLYMARFMYEGVPYTYYEKTAKQAAKTLADKRYEVAHGVSGKGDKVTLNQWFDTWFKEYKIPNVKESSARTYKQWCEYYILPVLGNRKLSQIRPVHIQQFVNDMQEKALSVKTIHSIYDVLFDILKIAENNELINRNPAKGVTLPKQEKEERRVLSVAEQSAFLAYLKNEKWLSHEPLFVVMLGTGLRVGEALGLTWDCIDFEHKEIKIEKALVYGKCTSDGKYRFTWQTPKTTSSRRTIPMVPEVEAALHRQRLAQAQYRLCVGGKWKPLEGFENLVFPNMSGRPYRETHIRDFIVAIIQDINDEETALAEKERREPVLMVHFSPHCLRHSFATRCFECGLPPKTVQTIMGHSSTAMTMDLYTHTTEAKKKEDMSKLAGVFAV
jgi:integrase